MELFWSLERKITSRACLLGSGLKFVFHTKTQLFIFFISPFKFLVVKSLSRTTEKRDASSANNFEKDWIIRSGSRVELLRISASTAAHVECWTFRTTFWFLSFKKFAKCLVSCPLPSFCCCCSCCCCFLTYKLINRTFLPNFVKGFRYVKKNVPNFGSVIKRPKIFPQMVGKGRGQ